MAGYIFGGNTGATYDDLQRKRLLAEQLMRGRSSTPRPIDGIASAAESIAGAFLNKKLDKQKSKLDDEWIASAGASGLDPARLAILKEMSPQQRNAYILSRMDAKPTGGGGGPSKSEVQAQAAQQAILAALGGGAPQPTASPDPSVNSEFTTGQNLSFGKQAPQPGGAPAPQMAGVKTPPVYGPIGLGEADLYERTLAAIERSEQPAPQPMAQPQAPQPQAGLSFGQPAPVAPANMQPETGGLTPKMIDDLRLQGVVTGNKALLSMANEMEKLLPKEPEFTSTIQNYKFYEEQEKSAGRTPKSFAEWSIMDEQAGNPNAPTASKERTDFERVAVRDADGNVTGYEDRVIPGSETAMEIERDSNIAIQNGTNTIALLDSIIEDPALPGITGMFEGRIPPLTQAGTDLNEKVKQVQGKAFLEAFSTLKGGGQITEIEGKKATAAIARLERVQSTKAFIESLNELKAIAQAGIDRARRGVRVDESGNEVSIGGGNAQTRSGGIPEGISENESAQKSFGTKLKENLLGDNDPTTQNFGEKVGSFLNKAGESMTFGLIGDEASAAVESVLPGVDYEARRDHYRDQEELFEKTNPKTALAAELGGAVLPALLPGGQGVAASRSAPLLAKMGLSGAITGTGAGLYGGMEGEGGLAERADAAKDAAMVGGGIGAFIPVAGAGVQKLANNRATSKLVKSLLKESDSVSGLKKTSGDGFDAVRDAGLTLNRRAVDRLSGLIDDAVGKTNYSKLPSSQKNMKPVKNFLKDRDFLTGQMDELQAAGKTPALNLMAVEDLRRSAGTVAGDMLPANRAAGMSLKSAIDEFQQSLTPQDIADGAGDPDVIIQTLEKARKTFATMRKTEAIDGVIEGADDLVSNASSGIRNGISKLLRNKKTKNMWTPAEKAVLRNVLKSGGLLNFLGGGIGSLGQMGAGFATGGVGGMLLGAAAAKGTRELSERSTLKAAEIARQLISTGKLGQAIEAPDTSRKLIELLMRQGTARLAQ